MSRSLIDPPEVRRLGQSSKLNMMIYAQPGAGKTSLIGSYPGKLLIVRPPTDHTDSILDQSGHVDEIVVSSWEQMDRVHYWLYEEQGAGYDAVALDSISLFQDVGLYDLFSAAVARKPTRAEFGYDKQEYGLNMQRLSTWVRNMVSMGAFDFFVTAHPFESEDPATSESIWMPFVQGKQMSEKVCGMMNIVSYLQVKRNDKGKISKRVLHFNNNGRYYAKDQFDAFKDQKGKLEDPTMPAIMDAINAVRSRATGPTKTKPKAKASAKAKTTKTRKGK